MNSYYLHHQGKDLGQFTLSELRRRRDAGELSGEELVWAQGMPDWQPLDSLLSAETSAEPQLTPPALPMTEPTRGNRVVWWAVGLVAILFVAGLVIGGIMVAGFVRGVNQAMRPEGMSDGVEEASQMVRTDARTLTEADVRKRGREFRIRQWLEAYKAHGDHSAECDALATQMLAAWLESNFGTPEANGPSVWAMCDSLAASPGCNDPLVLAVTALNATDGHEKIRRLERAIAGFENSSYSAYPKLNAIVTLITAIPEQRDRGVALFKMAVQSLDQCFRDGSFRPEDQAEIAEILVNQWGSELTKRSRDGVHLLSRRAGDSFDWLSLVLEGEFHVAQAWRARGGGYADTVTEEGWKGFGSHFALARTNFTSAWKLRKDLPLAPCRMITVAMGETDAREMRLWFDRTVAAQIDYPKAWTDMRWGLRPRWHGSLEAMLALGKLAAGTKRFDTDVPRKLFDVVSDIESELKTPYGRHIYGREDIWPEFQTMYEGYIAEPSEEKRRGGWRGAYSIVAYFAGKYDVARAQLEALNWELWTLSRHSWGADLSLMALEIAARTGSLSNQIADAEASYQRADVPDALEQYQKLENSPEADGRTRKFVGHRRAALEVEKRLQTGEWTEFLPRDEHDPLWVFALGKVRRLNDGALEVQCDKYGHLLYSRARLGANFEVKGEFEIVNSTTDAFQAGLVVGLPNPNDSDWFGFLVKNNDVDKQAVSLGRGWSGRRTIKPVALNKERNSFLFRFDQGKAHASLNGISVLSEVEPDRTMKVVRSEFLGGLGAYNDMNDTVLRYRNIQVRRLPSD